MVYEITHILQLHKHHCASLSFYVSKDGLKCVHVFESTKDSNFIRFFNSTLVSQPLKHLQLVLCHYNEKTSMHLGKRVKEAYRTLLISLADRKIAATFSLELYFWPRLLCSTVTDVACNLCGVWLMRKVRSGGR